jgi:hypothetical protein
MERMRMKLKSSYLCPGCDEVFNYPRNGEEKCCPSCTNRSVVPLTTILFKRNNVEEEDNESITGEEEAKVSA